MGSSGVDIDNSPLVVKGQEHWKYLGTRLTAVSLALIVTIWGSIAYIKNPWFRDTVDSSLSQWSDNIQLFVTRRLEDLMSLLEQGE